jgi:DNA-binding PadR family transcriptional regulator
VHQATALESFLPLKPNDFHILFALLEGPLHGYAMARVIEEQTDGLVRLEAGNLHRTLRKLVRQGLVDTAAERPPAEEDDERRRYWVLTTLGRAVVAADARRMRALVAEAEAKRVIRRRAERA